MGSPKKGLVAQMGSPLFQMVLQMCTPVRDPRAVYGTLPGAWAEK
jgi:hypothetical protein